MVSDKKIFSCFPYIPVSLCKPVTPGAGLFWPQGNNLNNFGRCYIPNIKALGLVVSDKKVFKSFHLENLFLPV